MLRERSEESLSGIVTIATTTTTTSPPSVGCCTVRPPAIWRIQTSIQLIQQPVNVIATTARKVVLPHLPLERQIPTQLIVQAAHHVVAGRRAVVAVEPAPAPAAEPVLGVVVPSAIGSPLRWRRLFRRVVEQIDGDFLDGDLLEFVV